ncbi:MAG: Do family serine endopeptidase [Kiritimatiellae bacterium]|nr:Do family serine endopeptidase [Kiritimatiellia bacterium]MDD5521289.1 Do family serine endopeptidase [Kiritimatiellia bacterium]
MTSRKLNNVFIPVVVTVLFVCIALSPYAGAAVSSGGDVLTIKKTGSAFTEVAKKAIPAVVFVKVEKTINARMGGPQGYYFNDPQEFFGDEFLDRFFRGYRRQQPDARHFKQQGQGSGFLITKDGYILTNNHIVGDSDKITVRLHDGREFTAKKIGSDPKSEVAVIKIDGDNFPYLKTGSSANLDIGEWVIAIGNPFGLNETLTVGVVSAKGRAGMGIADYEDFIQTDAAINPGNSGGPLLNIDGDVIGINTAIFSQSGGSLGIGFAIPIDMAQNIKNQLVKNGKVSRGYLGVYLQEITTDLAESFGIKEHEGILVADVTENSPASKVGIKHGDLIKKLNGKDVKSVTEFRNEVASNPPGTKLNLTISRDGKEKSMVVGTDALPDESDNNGPILSSTAKPDRMGITVRNLTSELAEKFDLDIEKGVVVVDVQDGSIAWRAGIQPGVVITGVNRKSVSTVAEFNKAILEAKDKVLLRISDGRISRYVPLKID